MSQQARRVACRHAGQLRCARVYVAAAAAAKPTAHRPGRLLLCPALPAALPRLRSYVGFDVIATSAEEAKNPAKAIPIAIIGSLLICMGAYIAVAAVVVLMVPYAQIDTTAPLSQAFAAHGATWAKYIIAVGAVAGLSTSLMTSIFPMPRIVYAIASDGLLPGCAYEHCCSHGCLP